MGVAFRALDSAEPIAEYMTAALSAHLAAGKRVLWLIAGGSAVTVAVAVSRQLQAIHAPVRALAVTLTDERFGDVGHADSNWKQLMDAGFSLPGAVMQPVLSGADMAATVSEFEKFLQVELDTADYRIGLFGIGADGHTSGILPHSSAVAAKGLAHGYDGGTFQRITTTPAAIARLDEAVVYAVGAEKWPALDRLELVLPVTEQPAQILKRIAKLTVFTDRNKKES